MAGKREKKNRELRLPAALILLLAASLLLTWKGPRGVAADSPVESEPPAQIVEIPGTQEKAETPQEVPQKQETTEPTEPSEGAFSVEPEVTPVPIVLPEVLDSEQQSRAEEYVLPLEDTYFENAAFLGDSRTEGFRVYAGLRVADYFHAIGATVDSVATRPVETEAGEMPLLDAMALGSYDKIYVMLGINELGWPGTDLFRERYAGLIDRLKADHPGAVIVLQTILPVSARQDAKGSYVNNERVVLYNEVIAQLAGEKDCKLLDVASAVSDENGCLISEWTPDGVHLDVAGCEAWLEYLRNHPVT